MLNLRQQLKQFSNPKLALRHYKYLLQFKSQVLHQKGAQYLQSHPKISKSLLFKVHNNRVYSAIGTSGQDNKPFSNRQLKHHLDNLIGISERNPILRNNPRARTLMKVYHNHGQLGLDLHTDQSYKPKDTIIKKTLHKSPDYVRKINRQDFKDLYKLLSRLHNHQDFVGYLKSHSNLGTRLYVHANQNGQIILNNGQSSFASRYQFSNYVEKTLRGMSHAQGITHQFRHSVISAEIVKHFNATKMLNNIGKTRTQAVSSDKTFNQSNHQRYRRSVKSRRRQNNKPRRKHTRQMSLHL